MREQNLPKHIAIVMDGNGRWAEKRNLDRAKGHLAGVESAREVVKACIEKNIPILSLFAFSSENIKRPQKEVEALMKIFLMVLHDDTIELYKNNIVLKFIGDLSCFSKKLQAKMLEAESKTSQNTGLKLIVAVNYGGRWDIIQACKSFICDSTKNIKDLNENILTQYLSTANYPDPDFFIRTSGESRISNFYLWQLTYTELYFTDVLWPDFRREEFIKALDVYAKRNRRFGLIKGLEIC